jgi:LysR family transcriptional activator of mexEF-oprN operon
MPPMSAIHESSPRDLDLNLFRVLLAVADTGSVTAAAAQLYLTQPAISAALARLRTALGEPVVARHGRGIVLTERGEQLVADIRPHLEGILRIALAPARFDPRTSEQIVRIGMADSADEWLLPPLLRLLETAAPRLRLVCVPVQFRTVADALATRRIEIAVTVADELPRTVARRPLFRGHFVVLFDPRRVRLGARPTVRAYLAQEHVIVSYNGDLRGVVEDLLGRERKVRCSVAGFGALGAIVDGSRLVATVPDIVARAIHRQRPHLRVVPLPIEHAAGGMDLLWPIAREGDEAGRFVRDSLERVVRQMTAAPARPRA